MRDEDVVGDKVPQRVVHCFTNTDAGSDVNASSAKAIVPDPQAGLGRREISSIIACAGDAEGLREAARTAG